MNFLQYHGFRGNSGGTNASKTMIRAELELTFAQEGDIDSDNPDTIRTRMASRTYHQVELGVCDYKLKHTWNEYLSNQDGLKKSKTCDASGILIMCTISDIDAAVDLLLDNANILIIDRYFNNENKVVVDNKYNKSDIFYPK